jgi:hypothetical protein
LRTDLLVGFISKYNIIQGKYDGADVPQPFLADIHGGSEACIQPSDDPSRAIVLGSILKRVINFTDSEKEATGWNLLDALGAQVLCRVLGEA